MEQLDIFENILLDDIVVDRFYTEYKNNTEFKSWLDGFLPEVEMCEQQEQHNPWHKYNVLGHILHSVEEMNKLTIKYNVEDMDRKMLAMVMFFHDIGKPACHITREKNGEMIDSFFNHNIESEKVFRRVAGKLRIEDGLVDIMAKMIYKHDIFMFIKDFPTKNPYWKTLSPEIVAKEIADLNTVGDGKKLIKYLILVGMADNLAQNEKMTGDSLRMLGKMIQMV